MATTTGVLRGTERDGICRFAGVPYARPPIGEARFRPPLPAAMQDGERLANHFGPASLQVYDPCEADLAEFLDDGAWSGPAPSAVGDEDSLTLNIWTPGLDRTGRPVIVWIHGGANWLESSRLAIYHGDVLSRRGDIVFVSLNYRLGIFGFLDVSVLGGDAPSGGHAQGLLDQLTALRWIADNAAFFGGDPARITLMGGSAGAMDISWLMTSGRLDGLVKRIVLMSGVASVAGVGRDGARSVHAGDEGRRRARSFLKELDITSWSMLQATDGHDLIARHAALAARSPILFEMDTLFYPRVDNDLLACTPFEAAASGRLAGFDVMLGFTEYEMGLWLSWDDALDRRSPEIYAERLPFLPQATRAGLAECYAAAFPDLDPGIRGMHLLGDAMFVMPSLYFAELLARHNPNVWVYNHAVSGADPRRGALHAADQVFFFGTHRTPSARLLLGTPSSAGEAAEQDVLAGQMQSALLAFVHGGAPTSPGLPSWHPYGPERRVMRFASGDSAMLSDPFLQRRAYWFDSY